MGFYINPSGMTKEEWLIVHATGGAMSPPTSHVNGGDVAVCLVDNGGFTAAGICFCAEELAAFARPDGRAKVWVWVPESALTPFLHGQEIIR